MRLYVDQMMRQEVTEALLEHGHDAIRAADVGEQRADDAVILETACRQNRVLITLDEHFGDWVVLPLRQHPGVIRLKVHPPSPAAVTRVLLPFLMRHSQHEFANMLVILSQKRVRWIRTSQ